MHTIKLKNLCNKTQGKNFYLVSWVFKNIRRQKPKVLNYYLGQHTSKQKFPFSSVCFNWGLTFSWPRSSATWNLNVAKSINLFLSLYTDLLITYKSYASESWNSRIYLNLLTRIYHLNYTTNFIGNGFYFCNRGHIWQNLTNKQFQ